MKNIDLKARLDNTIVEKDVENAYRNSFSDFFGDKAIIDSPYGCDGFFKLQDNQNKLFDIDDKTYSESNLKKLKILFEFKYNEKLEEKSKQAIIILQGIYYLKKFELDGKDGIDFPSILFIGDKDQCFSIHTNKLQKYLDYDLDWDIAPSLAGKSNPDTVLQIMNDVS